MISEQNKQEKKKSTSFTSRIKLHHTMAMLCREGIISLAGFSSAIILTIITTILTIAYLPTELGTFFIVTFAIAGPVFIYLISNTIVYFVISELDFAVSNSLIKPLKLLGMPTHSAWRIGKTEPKAQICRSSWLCVCVHIYSV